MARLGRILLASGAVLCFIVRLVVCQPEPLEARDRIVTVREKRDLADATISVHSDATTATVASTPVGTATSNETGGTSRLLGFGSNCSGEGQCDELLGLACTRNGNSTQKCACATSKPVHINEGGIHRCARAKNVNEACVINEECSFRNPNVRCINSFCNCSQPYVLTAAKLCLLPSSHGGDMFNIALIVALALVPLLLAARYAYQKMLPRRDSTGSRSSSFRTKRKRNTDASTSSSTTCIVPEDMSLSEVDNEAVYLMRDNDGSEAQGSRPRPRGPRRGSCMRDSSMPPRHPSCFINQRDTKYPKVDDPSTVLDVDSSSYESDDELELPFNGILVAETEDDPCATPLRRTLKEERLHSQARRKTGAELVYNEQDECRSTPMHTLGFKNKQMRNIIDKHRVVVTVEVHEPRIPGEAPKSPPIGPLWRRELPQSESTDDPFMKELKRRHGLDTRCSDRLLSRTRRSLSAEVLHVEGAAVHSDDVEVTPEKATPQNVPMVAEETMRDKEPANTGVYNAASVPVQEFSASTKAAKDQNPDVEHEKEVPSKAIEKSGAVDEILQPRLEHGAPKHPRHLQLPDQDDQCITGGEKRAAVIRSYTSKRRRASSLPVLRSCGSEDKTGSDKVSRLAETRDNDVTKPIGVEVSASRVASAFDEKGNDLQMHEAKQNTVLTPFLGTNRSDRPPTLVLDKDTNTGTTSACMGSAKMPRQNETLQDQLSDDGVAGKMQQAQTCHTGIKEVGEMARLLSRLTRTHEQVACSTSSTEDSAAITAQRPLRCKSHEDENSNPTYHTTKTGSMSEGDAEEKLGGSFEYVSNFITGAIHEKSVAQMPPSPVQTNVSLTEVSQKEITKNQEPFMTGESVHKATGPLKSEILEEYGKKPDIRMPMMPTESDKPRDEQRTEGKFGKLKLREETTPAEQSSLQTTTSEISADDAKYGSDRIGGRCPEAVPVGMPQNYRGWVPIGAAYAAQRPTDAAASFGLTKIVGNTGGARGTSVTSSDIGDARSASLEKSPLSSTPPQSTSSYSVETPYQEYMAKQLQPAMKFNERPFAEVLASMESEPTSTWMHNQISGVPDLRSALEKSSSARQSSGPSAINDENFDKATIESSSKATSGTDSATAVVCADVADTSSGVTSTCATQIGKIPVSSTKVKTRSTDGDDTSREIARALLIISDSDEGPIPLYGSMSLSVSFVSSSSSSNVTYHVSDLADLPRLQNNVAAANNETGDGSIMVRLPLPRLTSSAVQTESPRQPASSVTEFGEFTRQGCESTQEFLPRRNTASSGRDVGTLVSDRSFEQPLKLSDLILLQNPEVGLTGFVAIDFTGAADAHGGAEREGILLEAKTEREPRLNTHSKVSAVGPVSEVTCISNSSPEAADSQRRLELEGSGSNEATTQTVVARVTKPDDHDAVPQHSQHVTFLPNCAVAILLPGGTIRTVHPAQQASRCASPQGTAAIRERSPDVRTATVLDEATFESLYNAILQPPPDVTAAKEPSAPKDVNPVRATLSARALSSDDPLTTVMPMELPSGSSTKPDSAEATRISGLGAPSHTRKSRPQGSRRRSLSASRVLAVAKAPGDAATEVTSAAAAVPGRSGASDNNVTGAAGASPERPGGAGGAQEGRSQLLPPFQSFEEMYSEVCSRQALKISDCPVFSVEEERRGSDDDQTE